MNKFHLVLTLVGTLLLMQPAVAAQISLDSIVAIVDESVITRRELTDRIKLLKAEFQQSNRSLPKADVLERQVLEALINDSLLLQEAGRRGVKITDGQLNQTMQRLASQKKMNLSEFRDAVIADGLDYDKYRETVRRELTITTLGRQYSQRNATVSDSEVDDFMKLSQQFVEEILTELDQGAQFDQLANTYSAGETALQGGDLGWRKKAEIPSLFTTQILTMEPGDHAGPIRSASGFHIVHLKERRNLEQTITRQTRTRHILIKPNELISEEEARKRLLEFRSRILAGEDFARLAKLYSVDYSSGSSGGDIGWMEPGATVKEYETAANQLKEGELSQPIRSQFGWHLIEVTGRREVDETEQNKRNKIHSQLLEQKQREVFDLWKRRLRDEAYVVFPEKPDA
jgi:peptidyl-prolyl cis-trans isomerase SurA